ncbi:dipeptidase [Rosistilla oblonga]|uniref:dipeptidase n=1 Tax=Rosistilla oblonga TaxID=2527990 RepID=UPI003A96F9E2
MAKDLDTILHSCEADFQSDLIDWLKIPSISSDSRHTQDVHAAADWVVEKFRSLDLEVELIPTEGHPLVYAQTPPVPGAPVVLVYGHYDVQPVEPLDKWVTGPFEPDVRDGNIYARGATDDKGQVLTHIQSLAAWRETGQPLPLQIKYLIEGEEEVGSENLQQFLKTESERLACDVVVISDNSQLGDGKPAITYGLRGIIAFELHVDGPVRDLHSGSFGGALANPANVLCRMMSELIDAEGKIQIPGFYDDVRELSDAERAQLAKLPFDETRFAKQVGVDALVGEPGFTTNERRWARPTLDINGLTSGHQGEGGKTIVPSTASVKFTCRLVPDQNPDKIAEVVKERIAAICPPGVRHRLEIGHGGGGMLASIDSPYMAAAQQAIQRSFGVTPFLIREGGSIPIVAEFQEQLGAECLLLGWGLDDDNAHSPNEKFCLADFHRGIRASAYLWEELAAKS